MLNTIEDKFMVNPINEMTKMKPVESDNRLKTKHQESMLTNADNISSHDCVSLSSTSKQLEALKASLQDVPEINEARVLYFKAEIEMGNYEVNSDIIAMNMLNNVEMA